MTYQDIVNRTAGIKHRTEVKIENGAFTLNGVEFCVNFSSTCSDDDEHGNAVYLTSAGAETDDGDCAGFTVEFPYVSGWEELGEEEREALIDSGEQCDWSRAYIVSGIY